MDQLLELADLDPTAFDEGGAAFKEGVAEINNPYYRGTDQNRAWHAGWTFAFERSLQERHG